MSITARAVSWAARDRLVVDGVDLHVPPGATVGLLGPNGSGKSTLLRLLAGLRPASSGVVRLGDDDLSGLGRRAVARRLAVVDQESGTDTDPTVAEVVALGRLPHRRPWAGERDVDRAAVLRAATAMRTEHLLARRYATLSGGERQRVQLARALAQEPSELLLDEPTNHLDVRHQLELLALVVSADVTTVLALHDLTLAMSFCDEVVVLDGGRVVAAGAPATVVTADLVARVYGVEAVVESTASGPSVRYLRALPRLEA
ncbi:ABC transporter ATP-binding protein [Nocardioides sp. CFH 31398]|uniref:ABC transporter ATP-binding protein n=1 Tax=Nocardioides sp. CFH 31398 TaxID=2919579 RepID=UPI001F0583AE|nr:ABC transporter ATP-binding protein [Nocardioides sp. CFH 31398]MCH1865531.1 ABC transporter ATP-binding protein [Nocardioides sp. CFH 31398]